MGLKRLWERSRARILAAVILLAALGLIGAAAYSYLSYRKATEELIIERDRQVALLTAVRLRDELGKLADELQALARSQSLYLGLTDRQRLFLRGASQRLSLFDGGVILMDNSGRVRATVPERWDIMSDDWSDQEFFKSMLVAQPPAIHFSPVLDVGPGDTPVVVMSVPVLGEKKEMVGVLSGLFRLGESQVSAFYASIVRLRLAGSGDIYIVDGSGRIIYDAGYQRIGDTIDGELARLGATAWASAGFAQAAGQGGAGRAQDAEGHEVVAAFAPVPGTDWMLVTETDWTSAMASVQGFATGFIALLALGIIPALGLALLARGQRSDLLGRDQGVVERRLSEQVRQQLLPRQAPLLNGWDVGVYHRSAPGGAIAHDMYDFMLLPDGRLMSSLATVAEKGITAVHLLSTLRAAFRMAACRAHSAGQVLTECNNLICPELRPESAITSIYAFLDPESGLLQVASAGFCAPLLWRGGDLAEMREEGTFLGQTLDHKYVHEEVLLAPGESIIFYSPGVLGVRPETGDTFGPERGQATLSAAAETSGQGLVDALCLDLTTFADKDSLQHQDITVIALSRSIAGRPQEAGRSLMDSLSALGETDTDL